MSYTKIKLLKVKEGNGITLTQEYKDKAGATVKGPLDHSGLIHSDLKDALDALKPHIAMMTFVKPSAIEDIAAPPAELFEHYHVNGYSSDGTKDKPGIVITGHYINHDGKSVTLNTPFYLFDCASESRYDYMDDLIVKVEVIEKEVAAYLAGKRGEPAKPVEEVDPNQLDMFEGGKEKVTKIQIATPLGDGTTTKIPPADKDAMERVKEMDSEKKVKKPRGGKKVPQSAQHPDGEVKE